MSERPFRILGLQQIAIGGLDKAKLARLWVDTLGVPIAGNYRSERENVDEDILALGTGVHRVEVDLMQPVDPARKPAVHETPLNHVGLWVDMFGLQVKSTFVSERENVDEDICALGSGPTAVEVDLMQPLDPDKKPAVHTTPLNHVGLWVDDLPKAVEWMSANGVRFAPGGIRKGAAGYDICFIHPKGNDVSPIGGEGVLIELVQAPPEVIAAHAGSR